jgi:hypothetical protein
MILNDTQIDQILEQLLLRTEQEKLPWSLEDDHLQVGLPNLATVEFVPDVEGSDFIVDVKGPAGQLYGRAKASNNLETTAGKLYQAAAKQAGKSALADIMNSLWLMDSRPSMVMPLIPRISSEQAAEVLKKMAGDWDLDSLSGREQVSIRGDGSYITLGRTEPEFRLKILAWNERTNTVEAAKETLAGRMFQIEYLKLTPDTMTGHAKHDGHSLHYRRRKPYVQPDPHRDQ